jgi:glutaredoxin
MRPNTLLVGLALAAAASGAAAGELYRWVDENGRVHYTDQPPPPQARSAERKRLGDKPDAAQLPYALKEAVKNFPVTLYTADDCGEACKQASAYLSRRGVPFTEKDARRPDNANTVMSLTGGKLEVPVLTVGRNTLRGYEQGAWANALDAAGYPRSPALPPGVAARKVEPKPAKEATAPAPDQPEGESAN